MAYNLHFFFFIRETTMSADEFGMSNEEFQFFKEKLQKNVKEYLELEEQITNFLRKQLKNVQNHARDLVKKSLKI